MIRVPPSLPATVRSEAPSGSSPLPNCGVPGGPHPAVLAGISLLSDTTRTGLWTPAFHQITPRMNVIGSGSVGAKAGDLARKEEILTRAGFHSHTRHVISQDIIERLLRHYGIGNSLAEVAVSPEMADRIMAAIGGGSDECDAIFAELVLRYDGAPLVVRSSAAGDARGHGNYVSGFSPGDAASLRRAFAEVLAGYYREDAVAFRDATRAGHEFGVIFEPIVGQVDEQAREIAPSLSGFGYAGRPGEPADVNIVPGLGGGVVGRQGVVLTSEELARHGGRIGEWLADLYVDMMEDGESSMPALVRATNDVVYDNARVYAFEFGTMLNYGRVPHLPRGATDKLNLSPLFGMMEKVAAEAGIPQYFEWAMTIEPDGEIRFWILQIADAPAGPVKKVNFSGLSRETIGGKCILGSDDFECETVVFCRDVDDLQKLREYDKTHANYAVVYSGKLLCSEEREFWRLKNADIRHASALIEFPDARHVYGNAIDHFGGNAELTGKILCVVDRDKWGSMEYIMAGFPGVDPFNRGLPVYQGRVRVVGDAQKRDFRLTVS